jgi:hypothetical protein
MASLIDDVTDIVAAAVSNDMPSRTIAEQVLDHITQHPDAVGELYPGMALKPRPMTPVERGALTLPAANRARVLKENKRRGEIRALIETMRRSQPAITNLEIAERLNTAGIRPFRTASWTSRQVRHLLSADDQPMP